MLVVMSNMQNDSQLANINVRQGVTLIPCLSFSSIVYVTTGLRVRIAWNSFFCLFLCIEQTSLLALIMAT